MGTDLVTFGRAQLAGYAGLAGAVRGRAKPIAIIAAVDILAIALAFGAMHITGAMISGHAPLASLAPPAAAEPAPAAAETSVPLPRVAPLVGQALAAMPDDAVMFAQSVGMARGFTFTPSDAPYQSTFTPPAEAMATAEPQPPVPSPTPLPRPRPVQRLAEASANVVMPVIDTADGSLDRLLLRGVPAVANRANGVIDQTVTRTTATVTEVASAAPVVQSVTQPVAQVVQSVTGTVRGLLN
jgi:hypothetical protein